MIDFTFMATNNPSIKEIIVSAKDAYGQQNYRNALKLLDSALRASRSEPDTASKLGLLDLKCSALVKLDDLEAALEVAKSMIRLDKYNARGYYCAASIEQNRSHFEEAIRFLDYGCAKVSQSDSHFTQLKLKKEQLQTTQTKATIMAKPRDPMSVLPLELLQLVLAYLDYRHIIILIRVSKSWRNILCRIEPISCTLDFRKVSKKITYPMLRAGLARLYKPKFLALDNLTTSTGEVMSKKLSNWLTWTSLENLLLNDTKITPWALKYEKLKLKTIFLGYDTRIMIHEAFRIIEKCPAMREASFRRVISGIEETPARHDALEILEIGNPFDLDAFAIIPGHFSSFPSLQSLTVNGASRSKRLSWDLRLNQRLVKLDTYACLIRTIQLPDSLEQWLWDGTEVRVFNCASMLDDPPTPLPNLHTICLSGDNTWEVLLFLLASQVKPGQLKKVGLHNRQSGEDLTAAYSILDMLSNAQEFSFESESLQDHHSQGFLVQYPEIRELQLAAPRITGAFIADLLRCPANRIRKLVLKDCRKVEQDTIGWARSQGIEVEVHLGQVHVRGGRRMREGWF